MQWKQPEHPITHSHASSLISWFQAWWFLYVLVGSPAREHIQGKKQRSQHEKIYTEHHTSKHIHTCALWWGYETVTSCGRFWACHRNGWFSALVSVTVTSRDQLTDLGFHYPPQIPKPPKKNNPQSVGLHIYSPDKEHAMDQSITHQPERKKQRERVFLPVQTRWQFRLFSLPSSQPLRSRAIRRTSYLQVERSTRGISRFAATFFLFTSPLDPSCFFMIFCTCAHTHTHATAINKHKRYDRWLPHVLQYWSQSASFFSWFFSLDIAEVLQLIANCSVGKLL